MASVRAGELAGGEAVGVDGHQERAELGVGDGWGICGGWGGRETCGYAVASGSAGDDGVDEVADFSVGKVAAGALAEDQVESVHGVGLDRT